MATAQPSPTATAAAKNSTTSLAEEEVFRKWSAEKIAQWKAQTDKSLNERFKTLPELQQWLRKKGDEAHRKTLAQRRGC